MRGCGGHLLASATAIVRLCRGCLSEGRHLAQGHDPGAMPEPDVRSGARPPGLGNGHGAPVPGAVYPQADSRRGDAWMDEMIAIIAGITVLVVLIASIAVAWINHKEG